MAAPDYVPADPTKSARVYSSPPRRAGSWSATRPGDLPTGQPHGTRLGNQGPDQGYIFKLIPLFDGKLHLEGVSHDDAVSGCVAVALKRAAQFGRAPVVHDLHIAFTIFGFLDPQPPEELIAARADWFGEVASPHHYAERRSIADSVPSDVLSKGSGAVELLYETDWRKNINR